jgi:UDP-N-acetylglucosamine diphosphorylase/glucosamine-1-phosphate N-acetyltransferase
MNEIVLDETHIREDLFPFTLTRNVTDIRIGILTIREKWEKLYKFTLRSGSANQPGVPSIPANLLPSQELISATRRNDWSFKKDDPQFNKISHPWHIFQLNGAEIRSDFAMLTKGKVSAPVSSTNKVIATQNIFIEPGATVEHASLNASTGPIYIGKNAEIMEGAMIRGPFALCEGAVVKMGASIYGATTIGPYSVVGGEVKNSVLFGYTNKAHEGYLGDSVIGEWCNLGAGTSNSNLRNNAGPVKVWSPKQGALINAGQKCGLLMGDFSKSAINSSFNTGTVVGICCNIFDGGLTPKFIPNFSWGNNARYQWEKLIDDLRAWKKLKKQILSDAEIRTLKHIFDET